MFVSEPSRSAGHPLEDHFDLVTELAGYFPFYMAIVCSILFEFDFERVDRRKTVLENIEELFLEEAGMHFQFVLNSFSPDELRTCRKIIEKEPLLDIDKYIIRDFIRRGYLIAGDNTEEVKIFYKTLSDLLAEKYVVHLARYTPR